MVCFDFARLLRILNDKGYVLTLYPDDRNNIHIKLTYLDNIARRAFNVKEIVSLNDIEQYKFNHNCALCNIVLGLINRLDSQTQGFRRYTESVGDQDEK